MVCRHQVYVVSHSPRYYGCLPNCKTAQRTVCHFVDTVKLTLGTDVPALKSTCSLFHSQKEDFVSGLQLHRPPIRQVVQLCAMHQLASAYNHGTMMLIRLPSITGGLISAIALLATGWRLMLRIVPQ